MIADVAARESVSFSVQRAPLYVLGDLEDRMKTAHANHLGYPYNLVGRSPVPAQFAGYLINNLGDPSAGSHYASEVCDLEREAVRWLMDLWGCERHEDYWGTIGASGTEGNLWAIYLAREAFPDAVLLHSKDAHYSIPKAARILRVPREAVDADPTGAMDLVALRTSLARLDTRHVILALTCGTTVRGAHDDIGAALAAMDQMGFGPDRRYVHIDGALNAMVLPFLHDAPTTLQPTFRHAIDSISTSGHKMIGTPMPCGALIAKRSHSERVASAIAYLRSNDTTLMGSRNGHAVMALWSRLTFHGVEGFKKDARRSVERAGRTASVMRSAGVPVLLNPHSLTLVFPKPPEDIVRQYQLACYRYDAHAIIMPSVTDSLIARFLYDYFEWWTRENVA